MNSYGPVKFFTIYFFVAGDADVPDLLRQQRRHRKPGQAADRNFWAESHRNLDQGENTAI